MYINPEKEAKNLDSRANLKKPSAAGFPACIGFQGMYILQWARKFIKVQAKKTRKIKKLNFTKKKFAISKMTKNQLLNWEKFKTAKNAIDLFDFTSFLPELF